MKRALLIAASIVLSVVLIAIIASIINSSTSMIDEQSDYLSFVQSEVIEGEITKWDGGTYSGTSVLQLIKCYRNVYPIQICTVTNGADCNFTEVISPDNNCFDTACVEVESDKNYINPSKLYAVSLIRTKNNSIVGIQIVQSGLSRGSFNEVNAIKSFNQRSDVLKSCADSVLKQYEVFKEYKDLRERVTRKTLNDLERGNSVPDVSIAGDNYLDAIRRIMNELYE